MDFPATTTPTALHLIPARTEHALEHHSAVLWISAMMSHAASTASVQVLPKLMELRATMETAIPSGISAQPEFAQDLFQPLELELQVQQLLEQCSHQLQVRQLLE
jgi:hypothetical protein